MVSYTHEIKVNDFNRLLEIYRVFEDGRKELFTSVNLPDISSDKNSDEFDEFARTLGENILMDSPVARKIFSL